MGKKQRKDLPTQVQAEPSDLVDDRKIKMDDDIKEEPQEFSFQRNRKARLIVRNLSFKATEDKVKSFFSPYGELTDIQILRKPDGKLVGCCFIEYVLKNSAAKAIAHTSGKTFLNRYIVVDWAVSKTRFTEKTQKPENFENSDSSDDSNQRNVFDEKKVKEESNGNIQMSDSEGGEDDDNDNVDDSDDSGTEDHNSETEEDDDNRNLKHKKPFRESHDISEGCTVFVKNIPFTVDNQEFKKCMQKFGPVYYALICIDTLTEHSKGTGFVKFRSKAAADNFLAAGRNGDIVLRGNVLETHPALSKDDVQKGPKERGNFKKDGRNLYLIKEGVILAGSSAASGVSQADMAKRLQLEQWKTQMLKNLNKFVSRIRLVIQNLPPSYDDNKLRALCLKYGGPNTIITEARVMRDLRNVDANGKGKSKEYGFVTFTNHENALQALRGINNNPGTFTPAKRPIVAFSIEDRKALNLRQKRLERSKMGLKDGRSSNFPQKAWERQHQKKNHNNSTSQALEPKGISQVPLNSPGIQETSRSHTITDTTGKLSKKNKRKLKRNKLLENEKAQGIDNTSNSDTTASFKFMGENAKQGQLGVMSNKKLREQAVFHSQTLKSKNRKERLRKQLKAIKIKQPKQKSAIPKEMRNDDNFSTLVNKYKYQLTSNEVERKKWYNN